MVVIKNIEMPKTCSDCPMCHPKGKLEPWNYACFATMSDVDIEIFDHARNPDCPLCEVICEERKNGKCPYYADE